MGSSSSPPGAPDAPDGSRAFQALRLLKDVAVEKLVAKLALGVKPASKDSEILQSFITRLHPFGRHGKQFAPMRAGVKGPKARLDRRQQRHDRLLVLAFPG